jgi:hypothetical protein
MERPRLPEGLLSRLRADPMHAPETIALAAAEVHAPAAARWSAQLRSAYDIDAADLARRAKRRHAALARVGGAATGVGGIVTALPDLVSLAWIQSRLVFFVAAAYGYDPYDPMRPAELLVIQGYFDDPADARTALDGAGRSLAMTMAQKAMSRSQDEELVRRLLRFAGKRGLRRLGGRAIPGLAVVFNAVTNERDTRALADRAIRFYGG